LYFINLSTHKQSYGQGSDVVQFVWQAAWILLSITDGEVDAATVT